MRYYEDAPLEGRSAPTPAGAPTRTAKIRARTSTSRARTSGTSTMLTFSFISFLFSAAALFTSEAFVAPRMKAANIQKIGRLRYSSESNARSGSGSGSDKLRSPLSRMMELRANQSNDNENNNNDDGDESSNNGDENKKSKSKKKKKQNKSSDAPQNSKKQKPQKSSSSSSDQKQKQNENENARMMKRPPKNSANILSLLSNPYKAGMKLRETLDSVLTPPLSPEQRSIYYLDDRFMEDTTGTGGSSISQAGSKGRGDTIEKPSQGAIAFAQRSKSNNFNSLLDLAGEFDPYQNLNGNDDDEYIPEVLVIGATGAIGRLVVRRLVLSGKFRVRVLVRDLYSETLNMLGTGVTYCQGDLSNVESLEYAVTDVDKVVFCAGPPRKDESDFNAKFTEFIKENLAENGKEEGGEEGGAGAGLVNQDMLDFQRMTDTMELRAKLAQQVDDIGMQNLVRAWCDVRHADYGTSQAAKRSLFKFQDREEDFHLFAIDADDGNNDGAGATIKSQIAWIKNQFNHGVFVGKIPSAIIGGGDIGSEASIVSSRLRSRDDPDKGTDLSNGFAGFVCRVCADGKTYQAFIRTSDYETHGIEYVCKFQTETKLSKDGNKSLNKFITVRLPFSKFKPVVRRSNMVPESSDSEFDSQTSLQGKNFNGKDVKQIGFRINSADNIIAFPNKYDAQKVWQPKWVQFYLSISYIKVYRSQPEPEFIYLSDARIPPVLENGMVRHDIQRIQYKKVADEDKKEVGGIGGGAAAIFDEEEAKRVLENPKDRSGEELYYKYRGEEVLKNSGLQYSICRVPSLNELPSGEFSTIQLKQSNDNLTPVSRAEVAAVCVGALLDPNARNTCFYLTKGKSGGLNIDSDEGAFSRQFSKLDHET